MKRPLPIFIAVFVCMAPLLFLSSCASNSGPSSSSTGPEPGPDPLPPPEPSVNIFINQVDTVCLPSGGTEVTAYASVIDELGNRIEALDIRNFEVVENSNTIASESIVFTENQGEEVSSPISIAILMDYSGSVADNAETRTAMEDAVINFIELMKPNDRAAILKFNNGIRYIHPFTEDKDLLITAVREEVENGQTYLYDSLYDSLAITADEPAENRKAVVAITDGEENHADGDPGDGRTVSSVTAFSQAKEIPIFIIGLESDINVEVLQEIADGSSGHYYQAASEDELLDIYSKVSDVLNIGHYKFIFDSTSSGEDSNGSLLISLEHDALSDTAGVSFSYTDCQ